MLSRFLDSFRSALSGLDLFLVAILLFLLVYLATGIVIGLLIQRLRDQSLIRREREDAVRRSRAVLGGLAGEQVAPLLPGFPCDAGDVRFVGKPVDYVAFPGMSEGKEIEEVVFIEVKTGSAGLSRREKEIKAAVKAGRVRWAEWRAGK
ncbi:MAG: Holliday junction resolvase [Treponema sp.]|nr:Holliday junction resolvase [Treponema sp.]MCR5623296.1 Holliday junction resolvase [Treponema sp.]